MVCSRINSFSWTKGLVGSFHKVKWLPKKKKKLTGDKVERGAGNDLLDSFSLVEMILPHDDGGNTAKHFPASALCL